MIAYYELRSFELVGLDMHRALFHLFFLLILALIISLNCTLIVDSVIDIDQCV